MENKIKEQNFCNEEATQQLKDVGFDEECISDTPLIYQAINWLREEHELHVKSDWLHWHNPKEFSSAFLRIKKSVYTFYCGRFDTIYEAHNTAIIKACKYVKKKNPNLKDLKKGAIRKDILTPKTDVLGEITKQMEK